MPKDPVENLQYRAHILELAEEDHELRQDLYTACSQSLLFWVNAFVFTYRLFEPGEGGSNQQAIDKHLPMVTWAVQDDHLLAVEEAIDKGRDLLTDKSRDMGATWNHLAALTHRLVFRPSESHLMISRKEDAVDQLNGIPKNYPYGPLADPGTLFGKIDYILNRLPEWMVPSLARKRMHLVNLDNDTRIDGESSNSSAGSSDRRTSIFLDEMAKMKEGADIKRSTRDVTACRLVCSTPNGAGTAYSKWRLSGTIPVKILPWWEHPEKGRGRYVARDGLGRWKIRSPWYDIEEEKRTPKELAIEIDMDHIGSGDTFFEAIILEEHKKLYARDTSKTMTIDWKKEHPDATIPRLIQKKELSAIRKHGRGPMRIWAALSDGRLDQTKSYTLGIDISKGQGASNSVISIMCNETREKVAEWANAETPPYKFARIATAIAVWVGGSNGLPLVVWENNGDPGLDFGRCFVRTYEYPNIYFDRVVGTIDQKRGKRYGWRSSPDQKAEALGMLRRAYAHGGFINHSREAIDEALTYVHYEGGGLGPATLVEESASARKCHGDRVIADMLCVVGSGDAPRAKKQTRRPPSYSVGGRMAKWQAAKKRQSKSRRFDFTRGVA